MAVAKVQLRVLSLPRPKLGRAFPLATPLLLSFALPALCIVLVQIGGGGAAQSLFPALLSALPLALFSTRQRWSQFVAPAQLLRASALLIAALLSAAWAGPSAAQIYVCTVLVLGAFYVPVLGVIVASAAALSCLCAMQLHGAASISTAHELSNLGAMALVSIAPTCVAALLAELERAGVSGVAAAGLAKQQGGEVKLRTAHPHGETAPRVKRQSLRLAKEAAEAANDAKTRLFTVISHELRTPMNVVLGMTHLARMQPSPPAVSDYLEKIEGSAKNLVGILNDVLDFAKLDADRMTLERTSFSMVDLVDAMHAMASGLTTSREVDFEITLDEMPPYLLGDRLRLQQILSNLLTNSFKFTKQGKVALEIRLLRRTADVVVLRMLVRDTGIGMAPGHLKRLFEPFSQADSSTSRCYGGTGLGLHISRRLVELMGGRIEVQSELGAGTEFGLTLSFAVTDQKPVGDRNLASAARKSGLLQGLRVLVVEDHALNQRVADEFLQSFGIDTTLAANGETALALVKSRAFDLVLMDLQMPVMDGFDTTQAIRRLYDLERLPIIAMTADAFEDQRRRCYLAGMNDHVAKPFDANALVSILAFWSGRSSLRQVDAAKSIRATHAELPLIAEQAALSRLNDNQRSYRELLLVFLGDHGGSATRLAAWQESDDRGQLRSIAHRLKSEAHYLGLLQLADAATSLEHALRGERARAVAMEVEALASSLRATLQQIGKLLGNGRVRSHESAELASPSLPLELLPVVRELMQQLHAHKLDALHTLDALEQRGFGTRREPLHEVAALARQLRFREAAALLETVASAMSSERQ